VFGAWVIDNVINPFIILPVGGTPLRNSDAMLFSQIRSTDKQVAAFGQMDYKLTPTLTATLGGRISHTIAGYTQSQSGFLSSTGSNAVDVQSGSQSQYPWSGKAGLSWQVTPANMIYGSASRGYRVGGANQPINSAPVSQGGCGIAAPPTFGSDQVYSYELGTKGRAANGKLRFDVAGYYVDWRNIQQSIFFACAFGYITNSGNAVSKGFDVSLRYDLAKGLSSNLAVSYNHSAFTGTVYLPTATPGAPGSLLVSAGNKLAGAGSAPWNITGSIDYDFDLAGKDARLHLENAFKSRDGGRFPWQNPLANLYSPMLAPNPATNLLNARFSVNIGRLEVAAFANNILNSHPTLYKAQDAPSSLLFTALTLRPRTVGLSLDLKM
jgi:iron complex outermembrane receptor protein